MTEMDFYVNYKSQNLLKKNHDSSYITLILLGIIVFLLSGNSAFAGEKLKVAVYDFEAYGVPENVAQSATDLLRTELFRGGYFHVMERKQMEKILKEQKFQLSGAVAEEELINLGRILSVQLMAMGSMNRLGRKYIINLRLVDVEEGRLKAAETVEVSSEDEIHNGIKSLSKRISDVIPVRGKIIKLEGDEVVVSLGSTDKIDKGSMLKVQRLGETFKDPSTGKELGRAVVKVGTLRIDEVIGEQISRAKVIEETENIEVGDVVMILTGQGKTGSSSEKTKEVYPSPPSSPSSPDDVKKPAHVTVGLKTWTATWGGKFTGGSIKSEYGVTYGPNINVKHDKFFGGISYLTGGGFTFPKETFFDSSVGYYDVNYKAERTTVDLWAGYFFHPNIAGFAGYKSDQADLTYTSKTLGLTSNAKIKVNGPVLGVYGFYPINETRWVLFSNLSYMMLEAKTESGGTSTSVGNTTGPSIDLGGAYSIENMPLSVSAGYKYQNFKSDSGEDTFSGLTFGVNYSIQ